MPATSSNNLTHAPLPDAPHISTAKSPPLNPSPRRNLSSPQRLTEPGTIARQPPQLSAMSPSPSHGQLPGGPPVVSDVPITKGTSSSKSKVQPHPNFTAVENHERDVTHDLEMLDLGTASQSSKSKKKKMSIAMAASMASKKGVSGVKRKKPVEDNDGPGPSFKLAKGKEKVISWPFVAWPLLTRLQTAKKTKVAKIENLPVLPLEAPG
ncbi:hypothetical protein JB92DRAFT_2831260 [Gautieria morchelliformis]|nr:hypothetical protein JB92DRAFT_2831260 [Gautieria morchelliformis]